MKLIALLCVVAAISLAKVELFDQMSMIKEVNTKAGATWKAGYNKYFEGKSLAEIKRLMGALETPAEMKLPQKDIEIAADIPDEFDSRTAWPGCDSIKELRDQSNCGSCWAFGAVEAMSDRICIASGQKDQTRISAENLLSCCGFSCGQGCNGGYPEAAWNYFKGTGLVTGWLYNTSNYCQPYSLPPCDHHTTGKYTPCTGDSATPKCTKTCTSGYPTPYANDVHKASSVYSIASNVAKIQTEIQTNGPVEAAFTVYADFPTYKSGVYHHVSGSALGGIVLRLTKATPSKLLVGVLRAEHLIGLLPTAGTRIGETRVSSRSAEASTNAVLRAASSLVCQSSGVSSLPNDRLRFERIRPPMEKLLAL
jgi:cathepsin B